MRKAKKEEPDFFEVQADKPSRERNPEGIGLANTILLCVVIGVFLALLAVSGDFYLLYLMLILLVPSIIFGFVTQAIARSKGYANGFWWGFFLSFIGLIVVIARPTRKREYEIERDESATKNNYIRMLEHLAELRDKGIITEDEYKSKKRELMRRI